MSKFGINVPPGKAAQSLEDVKKAAEAMKDENNEVRSSSIKMTGWLLWLGLGVGHALFMEHGARPNSH
jgi:hypothetical protein